MNTMIIDNKEFREITDVVAPGVRKGAYYIARDGSIYSTLTNKFICGSINLDDYRIINLQLEHVPGSTKVQKSFYLHRLIMITFSYIENHSNMVVNHLDGKKGKNDNFDNYQWTDIPGNNQHAKENGLLCVGEDCPWAKLTEKQVEEICFILENDAYLSLNQLAEMFNCSRNIIRDIAVGNTWKHISCKYNIQYVPRESPKK